MNFQSIQIVPVDEEINLKLQSLEILNSFRAKGLMVRNQFVTKVIELDPSINNNDGLKKLTNFWLLRYNDSDFNEYLKTILKKI